MQFKTTFLISSLLLGAVCASPLTMDGVAAANTDSHTTPPKRTDFSCADRPDGYYRNFNDCTTYYACVGTIKYLMLCPPTLVYNEKIIQCDYPANVPLCDATPA